MDFDLEDGGRTVVMRWTCGDQKKEIRKLTTAVVYRGVFKEGQEYLPGDSVTRQGSTWHCNKVTKEIPGQGCKDWTLTVKRGSDGKDGARGEKGEKGDPGRNGRDLTQLGHDGQKWG
jgi:integrin beta 3